MEAITLLFQEIAVEGGSWLSDNWLVSIITKGGPMIMVPLFLCSIITLGILIERLYKYYNVPFGEKANKILTDVDNNIKTNGDVDSLVELLKKTKGIFGYVFLKIIMRYKFLVEEKRPILDMRNELLITSEESSREYLEEFLPIVNTIASVSTLLGLLGTILGMIASFDEIAKGGKGDPSVVAGGISIALITTATGLIVAIPAVLSYSFLKRKMEKILTHIEPFSNTFINNLLKDLARLGTYKAMLLTAYRDGVLNKDEQAFLKEKRMELNISEAEFNKLAQEIEKTTGHKVDLEKIG